MIHRWVAPAVIALGLIGPNQAMTDTLVIAMSAEATSLDPHFQDHTPNNAVARHVFDRFVGINRTHQLEPSLAESWRAIEPTRWEFKLRKGVTFHDGSPFTADDVKFTLERAGDVPNSPSSFNYATRLVTEIEIVDDHTIVLSTATPFPALPNFLSQIYIVSRNAGEGATTDDYNSLTAAIGTGAFRVTSYDVGERIVLEANADYWGGAPHWSRVELRPITNDRARIAALLAGDVDVIEAVPPVDVPRIKGTAGLDVVTGDSNRIMYFGLDHVDRESPRITALDGSAMSNPLRDRRVREALSLALNRDALVDRVMEGAGTVASQVLVEGFYGYNADVAATPYDPDRARALLAEAGFADGFRLVVSGPNDRYVNDASLVQVAAQMWSQIGLDVSVETMPAAVYFSQATNGNFSVYLLGWGVGTSGALGVLNSNFATYDADAGRGSANRGRYSNPDLDAVMDVALADLDADSREVLLRDGMRIVTEDVAGIPLFTQAYIWGARDGIEVPSRTDGNTLAQEISPR